MTLQPGPWRASFALVPVGAGLAAVTLACSSWFAGGNPTVPALLYLLIILITAAFSRLWIALAASGASFLLLNYFFIQPTRTFAIADPRNWVELAVLLAVSLMASQLSASARSRAAEAAAGRDEMARLFDLSRDILRVTDSASARTALAESVAKRFDLPYVAICLKQDGGWDIREAGRGGAARPLLLEAVLRDGVTPAAVAGAPGGQWTEHDRAGTPLQSAPLRVGGQAVGLLVAGGRRLDERTLDAVAGIATIAVERVELLDAREREALARATGELQSTILASLAHDLRTPLTAIRVAAGNLQAGFGGAEDRQAQEAVLLGEVERLHRLFQNILDMVRIETRGLTAVREWVTPQDIVEAAVSQAQPQLPDHAVVIDATDRVSVLVDPRLTAAALVHFVENASHYSPPGTRISIGATAGDDGLRLVVDDEGPGVAAEDLPRLFDRFFRGHTAAGRPAGLGMGLAIARGLVEAQGGTVGVENRAGGGARFWLAVPGEARAASGDE